MGGEPANTADVNIILVCNCNHVTLGHPHWCLPLTSSWTLVCVMCVPAPPWIINTINKKNLQKPSGLMKPELISWFAITKPISGPRTRAWEEPWGVCGMCSVCFFLFAYPASRLLHLGLLSVVLLKSYKRLWGQQFFVLCTYYTST